MYTTTFNNYIRTEISNLDSYKKKVHYWRKDIYIWINLLDCYIIYSVNWFSDNFRNTSFNRNFKNSVSCDMTYFRIFTAISRLPIPIDTLFLFLSISQSISSKTFTKLTKLYFIIKRNGIFIFEKTINVHCCTRANTQA